MAETWEEMTQAEKIEDLRRDIKSLFSALNVDRMNIDKTITMLNRHGIILSRAEELVKTLAEKIERSSRQQSSSS
jgi:hypothetical protein